MRKSMKGKPHRDKHAMGHGKHEPQRDSHRDGTGIPPKKFAGKKPKVEMGGKYASTKGKKARDMRLADVEM